MKSSINLNSAAKYREMVSPVGSYNLEHPAMKRMQELSDSLPGGEPTAISSLEIYKECHRLAGDLYQLTGSRNVFSQVMNTGAVLISRLFNTSEQPLQVNQ